MGDCCSCLGDPYPEPGGGGGFAPLSGLPQDVPSLWFDADYPENVFSGLNLIALQARYGTSPPLQELPTLPGAPLVSFGNGKAIPGGSGYYVPTPQCTTFGSYYDPAVIAAPQSAHIIGGSLPPAGAPFDGTGFMGILNWYYPEFWPFFLRRNAANDWRFGVASGVNIEFAENLFPLAGEPFFFGFRMQSNGLFMRFQSGTTIYEKSVTSAFSSATILSQNLSLGFPGGFTGRVWRGNLACYGVLNQAPFADDDIRKLCNQVSAYYGF